jgi:hypothetical protein
MPLRMPLAAAACDRVTMAKATLEVAAAAAMRVAADAHVVVRAALYTLEEEYAAAAALECAAAATRERVAPSRLDDAGWITNAASNDDARPPYRRR